MVASTRKQRGRNDGDSQTAMAYRKRRFHVQRGRKRRRPAKNGLNGNFRGRRNLTSASTYMKQQRYVNYVYQQRTTTPCKKNNAHQNDDVRNGDEKKNNTSAAGFSSMHRVATTFLNIANQT
jgi:hypothetical protein